MRVTTSRRRASGHAAVGVLLCLVLAGASACGDQDAGSRTPPAEPTSGGPSSPTAEPESDEPESEEPESEPEAGEDAPLVADPEHAVDPPGPREGALVPADLLVKSTVPLPDELVAQIDALRRVENTERLTLADVGIENRVLSIAAVDPATYRNYTELQSAELQEQWDRVAGGELSISDDVPARYLDKDGYLKLGNDEDAPRVHVGAFAPQVNQVDAVVNERWGEALGMPLGNALLVTTGIHSPREVMEEVQRLVGQDGAVSILGPDLDPGAFQSAVLTGGSVAEAVGTFRYTVLGGGRIQPDQAWVAANIRTEQVPILGRVTCHRVMIPQFRAALIEIQQRGLADTINPGEYAGCYYPRYIANTQQLSLHSFGIAFDVNVPGNQRGTAGEIDRTVVDIFKKWGFSWGGDWSWTDPMHFEMNRLVEAG